MLPQSRMVRAAIESLYDGKCTVTVRQEYEKDNGSTGFMDAVILEDEPCRLSFKNTSSTKEGEVAATVSQVTELFISPEVDIPSGSKITVTQNGESIDYAKSGVKAKYETHQEIVLNLWEKWS